MKLRFKKYPRFGVVYCRPDCKVSKALCEIASRKAFSEEELKKLEEVGFEIILQD